MTRDADRHGPAPGPRRRAGRHRRPRPAAAAATPTTAGSAAASRQAGGRCTSWPSPAAGRTPTPGSGRRWPRRWPRSPTAPSCSSTGSWPAASPRSSAPRRAASRSSCWCTCRWATRRAPLPSWWPASGRRCAAAAAVVATSPWTARRLADLHGLDPDRITVAAPGVDPAPLAPGTDGASHLLCVGSITPTKGQDLLVEALAGLPTCRTCDLVGPVQRDPAHVAAVAGRDRAPRARRARPADRPEDGRRARRGVRGGGPAGGALARRDLRDGRHRGARPGRPGARVGRGWPAGDARSRPGRQRAGPRRACGRRCGVERSAAPLDGANRCCGTGYGAAPERVEACCTGGR